MEFAETHNLEYFETSAKDYESVEKAFIINAKTILKKIEEGVINPKTEVI